MATPNERLIQIEITTPEWTGHANIFVQFDQTGQLRFFKCTSDKFQVSEGEFSPTQNHTDTERYPHNILYGIVEYLFPILPPESTVGWNRTATGARDGKSKTIIAKHHACIAI